VYGGRTLPSLVTPGTALGVLLVALACGGGTSSSTSGASAAPVTGLVMIVGPNDTLFWTPNRIVKVAQTRDWSWAILGYAVAGWEGDDPLATVVDPSGREYLVLRSQLASGEVNPDPASHPLPEGWSIEKTGWSVNLKRPDGSTTEVGRIPKAKRVYFVEGHVVEPTEGTPKTSGLSGRGTPLAEAPADLAATWKSALSTVAIPPEHVLVGDLDGDGQDEGLLYAEHEADVQTWVADKVPSGWGFFDLGPEGGTEWAAYTQQGHTWWVGTRPGWDQAMAIRWDGLGYAAQSIDPP